MSSPAWPYISPSHWQTVITLHNYFHRILKRFCQTIHNCPHFSGLQILRFGQRASIRRERLLLMAMQSEAVCVQWTTAENSHIFTTIPSPFCKVREHEGWWVGSNFHSQASFSLTKWNKWNITARLENLADGHNHPFITDIIVVSSSSDKINNKMAGNKDQDN